MKRLVLFLVAILCSTIFVGTAAAQTSIPPKEFVKIMDGCLDSIDNLLGILSSGVTKLDYNREKAKFKAQLSKCNRWEIKKDSPESNLKFKILMLQLDVDIYSYKRNYSELNEKQKAFLKEYDQYK